MKKFILFLILPLLSYAEDPFIYNSVNVINGEYCEAQTDLNQLRRFYNSGSQKGEWNFNIPDLLTSSESPPGLNVSHSENCCEVTNKTGQKVSYRYHREDAGRQGEVLLIDSVASPLHPACEYSYAPHAAERRKVITERHEPNGRYVINEYYQSNDPDVDAFQVGKVKRQLAPAGHDETPVPTTRFVYKQNHTEVYDALNHKMVYVYSNEGKLTAIETHMGGELYRRNSFCWRNGQLKSKVLEDGKGAVDHCVCYEYDQKGRLILQTLHGNLTGAFSGSIVMNHDGAPASATESFSKWFVYSDDDKSLLLKEGDDSGLVTRFSYDPITDQLIAKYSCHGDQIFMRTLNTYNDHGHLVQISMDNGRDELSTSGVTEGKIIKYQRIEDPESPAFGLPSVIDECYFSGSKEELFSRTINHFDAAGLLVHKEILNSDLTPRYSQFFQYNEKGKLISSSESNGKSNLMAYDDNGNQMASGDEGAQCSYRYDFMNRVIGMEKWSKEGPGISQIYRHDALGNRIAVVDTFGNTTRYEYDECNRPCRMISPAVKDANGKCYEPTVVCAYDIRDRCVSTTYANGETVLKEYNARGQPTLVSYADGTKEQYSYNLDGTLARSINAKGIATCYHYDYLKRKTAMQVYSSSGELVHELRFNYNTFHLLSVVDADGVSTEIRYNELGQQTGLSMENREIEYIYDATGTPVGTKEWFGDDEGDFRKTRALRDEHNQIKEIRIEDSAGRVYKQLLNPEKGEETPPQFRYDAFNDRNQNVLSLASTNSKGVTTEIVFDALGREESVSLSDPYGQLIHKTDLLYDRAGNKARVIHSVRTPEGFSYASITNWEYGFNRKLLSLTEASATASQKTIQYIYSSSGELASILKADGEQLFYSYDNLGRMNRVTSSDGTIDYTITYDQAGRMTEVFDAVHNTCSSKVFDSKGLLTEETLANGLTLRNEYDRLNRKTLLTLPDFSSVVYEYDAAFLRAIHRYSPSQEKKYSHLYTAYNDAGYLVSEQLIGGCGAVSYERNEKQRLVECVSPYWKQSVQGYDSVGNLLQMTVEDPLGTDETSFSFDSLNQVTDEAGQREFHYEYDSIQNRCGKNDDCYELDLLNQLQSTEDVRYYYDGNGSIVKKVEQHHTYQYTYDALNRLIEVVKDDEIRVRYTYDIFHRRLTKQTFSYDSARQMWNEGEQSRFIFDGEAEIGLVNGAGQIEELRVLGIGQGAEIGASVAIELKDKVYAPLHDQMGSVRCLVDISTRSVEEFYRYSTFGEEELFDGGGGELAATSNPWRYMSKRFDPETGLIFFGRRYYEPSIGRFTTKDPLQFIDGPNQYAFVHNNPLANRDLYGLYSVSDIWGQFYEKVSQTYEYLADLSNKGYEAIQKEVDYLNYVRESIDIYGQGLFGELFFILTGYDAGEAESGVYGEGEINDKVRITWINGILNFHSTFLDNVKMLSETHGGNNVHYIFKPTEGWGSDLMAAVLSMLGYTSPDAKRLAKTWKELIEEMGGVDGDGMIIHYAHSIGGTETYAALHLLTPEERRKIRVITFGSATIIPGHGLESAINYVSRRDFMAQIHMFEELFVGDYYHIKYIGSYFGRPFVDHLMDMDTYAQVVEELGRQFVDTYGSHNGKR